MHFGSRILMVVLLYLALYSYFPLRRNADECCGPYPLPALDPVFTADLSEPQIEKDTPPVSVTAEATCRSSGFVTAAVLAAAVALLLSPLVEGVGVWSGSVVSLLQDLW